MFIRPYFKTVDGRRLAYWALVESYRSERGPRQRIVAWLGQRDEAGRLGVQQAALDQSPSSQKRLFPEPEPEWIEVDASAVRVENRRRPTFGRCLPGGPWLALELIKTLGLDRFLCETIPAGRADVPGSAMALVLIIARFCEPSSELSIAENFIRKTAVLGPLGRACGKGLRQPLVSRVGSVVAAQGRYGKSDRIWVMDRGMVSEDNIAFLRKGGRRYLVGTPKPMLKRFEQELLKEDWHRVREGLEVKLCAWPSDEEETSEAEPIEEPPEIFILCRSQDRSQKEEAIMRRFEQKIEDRLTRMQARCERQRRDPASVEREVGRVLAKTRGPRGCSTFAWKGPIKAERGCRGPSAKRPAIGPR